MDYRGVLVGLGNPGPQYDGTRHNAGFALVDRILDLAHLEGEVSSQRGKNFDCDLWRVTLDILGGTWLVAKPLTFMNLSGQCVQPLLAWHRLTPKDLVVVHDEMDIPAGSLRFKFGGGNAGHNGLKSITQQLGTPDFYRLRLGVGKPEYRSQVVDWVLTRMQEPQKTLFAESVEGGVAVLRDFVKRGLDAGAQRATRETKRISAIAEDMAKEQSGQ